jgi:ADP-ribose pyrophosphatase
MSLPDWRRTRQGLHADCRVYKVLAEGWEAPAAGMSGTFYILDVADWVVTMGRDREGRFCLVRQFRFGSEKAGIEFPAGLIDAGESVEEAARRELYEESGYGGGQFTYLGSVNPNPALQRNRCHFASLEGIEILGPGAPDEHESFEVLQADRAELDKLIREGAIDHAIFPCALHYLDLHMTS